MALPNGADAQEGMEGFGVDFGSNLEELNKAIGTGTDGEAYGDFQGDMSALRPQSLEGTLKIVAAKQNQIKFWNELSKKPAYNTVEEFNVLDSYGGNSSPFFTEGGLPSEEDSNYIRQSQMVKFLGTTRVLTHPATLVRTTGVGDIVAREQTNGTLWLLQQMERALYFADSNLNGLEFDGLYAQVRNFVAGKPYENQHIIDMQGQPIDENILEDAATIIADNFGSGSLKLHMTNQVHKDFSKLVTGNGGRQRVMMSGNPQDIRLGQPVRGYSANAGDIDFVNNIFLKPQPAPVASAQNGAPSAPTVPATPLVAGADATSKLPAGTYFYFVSAKNADGESVPVSVGSVASTSGQAVTVTINRVTSAPVAKTYKVYRGLTSDVTKAQLAFEVKDAQSGTTQAIVDRNFDIPGTHKAFLIDFDAEEVLTFKQLAPLMKLPLARIAASERFMILLYGMLQVYNPRRIVVFKNIGTLGTNSNRELFLPSYGAQSYGTIKPVLG